MEMKKNETFTVRIQDISEDGAGVGKVEGYIWFIKDTVIGDLVEARVMKTKKSYGFARLLQILEPSPFRVEPMCPVARACGGCSLQAMGYEEQLRFKERKIYNALRRIGGVERLMLPGSGNPGEARGSGTAVLEMEPIIGMEDPWRYRNKAQFPVGRDKDGRIIFGFYAGRTHSIIENEDCLLGVEEDREILKAVRAYMERYHIAPYDEATHTGLVRHVLIRKGFWTGEMMVCLVINGEKLPHGEWLVERLTGSMAGASGKPWAGSIAGRSEMIPESCGEPPKGQGKVTSISYDINMEKTNVILGPRVVDLYGPGYITDYIGDVRYQISPQSFYQVNPVQTEKLYGTALEYAGLTGEETVWDLYCGIGTISLFLARQAKKVYGVEIVPAAIEDARRNAALNGIENVEFFVGKAEEVLPRVYRERNAYADVIVVDPPRKGCDKVCLDTIVEMGPKKVVYVSCDPATLGRDVKYLEEKGYAVERVRGCDMFPGTFHVETVVMLSHKKPDSVINVKVEFGEGEGKVPLDNIAKRAAAYKPKERITYKMIKEYIEAKYGFKVHTTYIAEVKRELGLPMYDAPNAVDDLKQPRKHPTEEKVEAIKDALKYFEEI